MNIQAVKEKIESLDPVVHKALRDSLLAKYTRLTGEKGELMSQGEPNSDLFAGMFKKAVDELNRRYIAGTIGYIQKHHPDLYQKTNTAEDRLNRIWKASLDGKVDIEEFRKVLKEWYFLNLQGIEIYSKTHRSFHQGESLIAGRDYVLVESKLLAREVIVLCFEKHSLKAIEEMLPGKVIYFSSEIEELYKHKDDIDSIKKIHFVKKEFNGWIVPVKHGSAER